MLGDPAGGEHSAVSSHLKMSRTVAWKAVLHFVPIGKVKSWGRKGNKTRQESVALSHLKICKGKTTHSLQD